MPRMFELYLIRHAVAEERSDAWPDDAMRPLTEQGKVRMRRAARGLEALGVTFDIVLSSPLVRAHQTADIVAAAYDRQPAVAVMNALAPGARHAEIMADLGKHSRRRRIALVGHEPDLGELAARLVGAKRAFEFKKGGVCRIDVEAVPPRGPGLLRWLVTPAMLRGIGR